jgi:uncharacterized protein involved in exopolysaccharide biosynthesis
MRTDQLATFESTRLPAFSARDFLAVGFRRKRVILLSFFGILLGTILAVAARPSEYKATTKFLIERERVDPVVSSGPDPQVMFRGEVTEEELNSEVELLGSEDVLRQVVLSCGLNLRKSLWGSIFGRGNEQQQIAKAVARLRKQLTVEPIKKTTLIAVSYTSPDPQLAARVLSALDEAYMVKNVAVHRIPGQFEFFDREAEQYKKQLSDAEAQLKAFSSQEGGVAPQLDRDITMQKLNEFEASVHQTQAEMAATANRIRSLERQSSKTPQRLSTQRRETDDGLVLQGSKATLMKLELQRTELLTKFQPTYPLVQQVDKQIADTNASIMLEESKPLREETTDRNPTYAWMNTELAKAYSDYSGLQARLKSTQESVSQYGDKAIELEQKLMLQQDLLRTVKTAEEYYLGYQRKREAARTTDALNRTGTLNVAIVERPEVPTLPADTLWLPLVVGVFLAMSVSMGMAFTLEHLDPSFRTPAEVLAELNVPLLAAVPREQLFLNGKGHGSGEGKSSQRNGHGSDLSLYYNEPTER